MNIAQLLVNSALTFPERPAVSVGCEPRLDYAALGARAAQLAAALQHLTADSGNVAITLPNCPEYLEILFGTWHAGLAAAPMNARLNASELAFMIGDCGARVVFAGKEQAEALRDRLSPETVLLVPGSPDYSAALESTPTAVAERDRDDLAWIFYTSGTTGKPKGAMLSHGNLMAMTLSYYADIDALDERDALLHVAATSHASGLFGLSFIARAGNNVLLERGGFDPTELVTLINHYASLSFFMPPTLLRRLDSYPELAQADMRHVKAVLLGAAPITPRDLRVGHALFGPRLWNGYGQGESPCTITAMSKAMIARALADNDEARLSSVGIVRTGLRIAILDERGDALPTGEAGEVAVRGATVMRGYLNRPDATAETLVNGWLRTGDVGRLDERGFLTLLDRKKDVIISGGMNIYAREVEDILLEAPGVADIAVIGIPDEEWGEAVVALVVTPDGHAPDHNALNRFCLERMARFKRPKYYLFLDELPRNASGKVLKRQLRQELAGAENRPLLAPA
ncbi:MAG: AMP-binding protein [Halieaceae bacterium]|nr:AMP-binding protein [Halieaceae bacterium]